MALMIALGFAAFLGFGLVTILVAAAVKAGSDSDAVGIFGFFSLASTIAGLTVGVGGTIYLLASALVKVAQ